MNILLYYQNPSHTVFLESLVESFVKRGHTVHFLTTCDEGILHQKMRELGAITHTHVIKRKRILYLVGQALYLIRFCRKNKINAVVSHLQMANLIALLAQYFIKARVFPCRHHSVDVVLRGNKNAIRLDKWVNRLSKKIIVVSNAVKTQMVNHENINPNKVVVIPLGYNFSLYDKPEETVVNQIKEKLKVNMVLILVGRMTINKRHMVALEAFKELVDMGLDVGIIIMDDGPEMPAIRNYIVENKLSDRTLFTGFIDNTINHMAAADLLIQPSMSEASNQVVKEAAMLSIPSVVCNGVGDFDEYVVNEVNGFTVNIDQAAKGIVDVVKKYYSRKEELKNIGAKARIEVLRKFDINEVGPKYLQLMENK
ncbi:MAG: glycosyltransferase family 4 protein [Flavobacteriales bacterium]